MLLDIFLLPYRNDQNVLSAGPTKYRLISTEEGEMKYTKGPIGEYITDSELIVPAISYELRERYVSFDRLSLVCIMYAYILRIFKLNCVYFF